MNAIFQLLNPSNTVTVNRPLAHAVGLNEAVIYGALISKFHYFSERGMLDDGWFYSTAPDLAESTALSEKQQKRAVDKLIKAGLVRSELRGMPAKRSFYIIQNIELLQSLIADGEAKMKEIKPIASECYEKKRRHSENTEPTKETQELIDFLSESFGTSMPKSTNNPAKNPSEPALTHCSDKRAEQAPTKEQTLLRQKVGASSDQTAEQLFIKSKGNNPINQSITNGENSADRYDMIDLLKKNIHYDFLCELNKDDKNRIDELLSIMLDVICSSKPTVRVNGEELPKELVKNAFLGLGSEHISYVLDALRRNTTDVRNIRSYLITALYNAPSTIDSYYAARVNHDMWGKEK